MDNSIVTITVTPLQAAIIFTALEEYQADFEAALNGFTVNACPVDNNQLLDYVCVAEETAAARQAIIDAKIYKP